jgi:hypothetical protein
MSSIARLKKGCIYAKPVEDAQTMELQQEDASFIFHQNLGHEVSCNYNFNGSQSEVIIHYLT